MRKKLFCILTAMAVTLSMPATLFASDTLVDADGTPVSSRAYDDGWRPASLQDLMEDAALTALAEQDPSIVIEDEKADPAPAGEESAVLSEGMRSVSVDELLADTELAAENGIRPVSVSSSSIGTSRYSNTSGNVTAYAGFTKKASTATCTITLQQKSGSSWVTPTGIPVLAYKKTVYNSYSIAASKTFTLKKGKVYRARITFSDKNSSGTYSNTRYTGAF